MSKRTVCCVPGCSGRSFIGHILPTDPTIREIWLKRIGNATLDNLPEMSMRSLRVCNAHFESVCISEKSGRLRPKSLPTLGLPGYTRVPGEHFAFLEKPQVGGYTIPEKIRQGIKGMTETATTSLETNSELSVLRPTRVYGKRLTETVADKEPAKEVEGLSPQPSPMEIISNVPQEEGEQVLAMLGAVAKCSSNVPQEGGEEVLALPGAVAKCSTIHQRKTKRRKFQKKTHYQHVPRNMVIPKGIHVLKKKVMQLSEADTFRQQLQEIKNASGFDELQHVNDTTYKFIMNQIRKQRLKPQGRRFTLEDKIFALSAYRQSPKGYRYLSKFFSLPSCKTLSNILAKVPFECGINPKLFEHLQGVVSKLEELDRYCVLMFDKISLKPNVQGNRVDSVMDYDHSDQHHLNADHALVFMVKGIQKKWKQPICFYFCESSMPTAHFVGIIKDVIRHVRQTGLEIVATICDQESSNCAAVRYLLDETERHHSMNNLENRLQGYLIDGKEVVHFFDPPHLLKGIRNVLLSRDLQFRQDGKDKVASWNHIVQTFHIEKMRDPIRSLIPSVTEEHVIPSKIKKTRVLNCIQVFSRHMGQAISIRAENGQNYLKYQLKYKVDHVGPLPADWCIEPSGVDTAALVHFLDDLFDSVNGTLESDSPMKELRGAVTMKSSHVTFWQSAIPILQSMRFLPSPGRPGGASVTPSIKYFIFTLRSFLYTWSFLKDRGFKSMSPRCFNQDPLENFFSLIRSHGVRKRNPTCASFKLSFKSLILNNFMESHSVVTNCEEDDSEGALDTLKNFLMSTPETHVPIPFNEGSDYATPYVAEALMRKVVKSKTCFSCQEIQCSDQEFSQNCDFFVRLTKSFPP